MIITPNVGTLRPLVTGLVLAGSMLVSANAFSEGESGR